MSRAVVSVAGTDLPGGSCAINVYYSAPERVRFASFLTEALSAGQGAVLACDTEAYAVLRHHLSSVDFPGSGLERVELSGDLAADLQRIVGSVKFCLRKRPLVRVLVDFGQAPPKGSISDGEAALAASLRGLPVVTISQYDGTGQSATAVLEQCRSHAVAFIGNVLRVDNTAVPERSLRHGAGQ